MGKRSDFKKRKNDKYYSPIKAMEPLLPYLLPKSTFIEPCAGSGDMVDFFESHGHKCIDYFDIEPTRKDVKEYDAFDYPVGGYVAADFIISNPPWTRSKESGYLMNSLIDLWASIRPTWLLFDASWANNKTSAIYIEKYCEKIVPIGRVKWIEDSKYSGKDDVCWYLMDVDKKNKFAEFYPRGN